MRLAIIAPHFPEYSVCYAAGIARHCDVLVCVDVRQLAMEYEGRDVPRGRFQLERVHFRQPLDLLRQLWLVIRFRPTVVHFQEAAGPRRGWFNAIIATVMKPFATIVLTVHDPVPHEGRDAAVARRVAHIRDYLRRRADITVVHGGYCERRLRESAHPPRGRIVQSEIGLILEPEQQAPAPGAPLKLFFFGRMEAYKGLEVLLTAVEQLHEEKLAFTLSIAGSGPELDRLEERFALLPEVRVFNGFAPPNRIMALIQEAGCVLLPYLTATQSAVLAAAFAGRRPVIASATGGLPDVVHDGHNGLLVPPGDPRALADAIRRLAGDAALRAKLAAGAAQTAREVLNWDRIGGELHAAFGAAE